MNFLIFKGTLKVNKSANPVKDKMHLELYIVGVRYRCAVVLDAVDEISPGCSALCKLICVTENIHSLIETIERLNSLEVTFGSSQIGILVDFSFNVE